MSRINCLLQVLGEDRRYAHFDDLGKLAAKLFHIFSWIKNQVTTTYGPTSEQQ